MENQQDAAATKGLLRKGFDIISKVVFIATVVTAMTPSTVDNEYLQKGVNMLNVVAGNFGFNMNADAPSDIPAEETVPVEKTCW